ncbi:EAL domain-containing protein (putative c-di-GMP-specific phosphodiesterase class I) [Arthrobacter globiformis]|uniref:EAL domain-containing protein n=1 Tax=Arthrobacter globiformis TaxID=1665 RepID=UPI00277D99C8|nr:EAL domain-containing protein [Arthrobacter globiformis]MDQ1060670.1 EAL domain-containing protein (putative c-di-GMP-specific phosphodiesterase class I) [Arthrobacter globiformis]
MSWDENSLPALTDSLPTGLGAKAVLPADIREMTVRWQAHQIITELLAESDPASAWTRAQLRALVEAHPDNPEHVLLEHLTATTELANAENGAVPVSEQSQGVAAPEPVPFTRRSRNRIEAILADKMLMTAFQPIRQLPEGHVIGVEALTRFVSDDGASADHWFNEAESVGLGTDLELAALHRALSAAQAVPDHMFIALNLTPATCADPRIPGLLEHSQLAMDRIVIDLNGAVPLELYPTLTAAIAPLRRRGLRIAVNGAEVGFTSMDQVLELHPDVIKLDRSFIAGIEDSPGQRLRAAAMAELARYIDAAIGAQGVETPEELEAVTELGMAAAQGYLLGRPSVHPLDWNGWIRSETETATSGPAS